MSQEIYHWNYVSAVTPPSIRLEDAMASQGPNYPGTTADDATVGSITWSSTGNIAASDGVRATAAGLKSSNESHYITATNLSMTIPDGATIDGIVVEIDRHYTTGGK